MSSRNLVRYFTDAIEYIRDEDEFLTIFMTTHVCIEIDRGRKSWL